MLVSTEIYSYKRWGSNEEILKLIKESGFEAYDFSMTFETPNCFIFDENYKEKAKSLREYADSIGLVCNQTHAPFPALLPPNENYANYLLGLISKSIGSKFPKSQNVKNEYNELMDTLIARSLEISGILGAKACVIHPINYYNAQQNLEIYKKYLPIAKKFNVKIATENMWNDKDKDGLFTSAACSHHSDFLNHIETVNDKDFVACLDIGHAELKGLNTSCEQMIQTLKNSLFCLHVHDNNGLGDEHKLPFTADIDFDKVTTSLAKIGYAGDITMETDNYLGKLPVELFPIASKYMFEVGDYLRKQIKLKS